MYSGALPNFSEPQFLQWSDVRTQNLWNVHLVSDQEEPLWLLSPSVLLVGG